MSKDYFVVKTTKKYGRGLYANKNIKKGEIINISPVLVIEKSEANKIVDTILNIYVFEWSKDASALSFGYGSLFNHSKKPNVTYMNNFSTKEIFFITSRNIKKGEQLFINYGYEPEYGIQVYNRNKQNNLCSNKYDGSLGRIAKPINSPMEKEKAGYEADKRREIR